MPLCHEHHRSNALSFSMHRTGGTWCEYIFYWWCKPPITLLSWYLLGFSTVKLPFFPLQLMSILEERLWDYPVLLNLFPTNFSIHQWTLPAVIISLSLIPSPCINWNSSVRKSSISLHQYEILGICSILWITIQDHHYCQHFSNLDHWEPFQVGTHAIPTSSHPFLSTSLLSGTARCSRLILYDWRQVLSFEFKDHLQSTHYVSGPRCQLLGTQRSLLQEGLSVGVAMT